MEKLKQNLEKSPEEKILVFENLDEKQVQTLKEEIQKSNGLVRVFIHADWITDEYEKRIKDPMFRLLQSEKSPPIFFFEDVRDFEDVKKVLELFNRKMSLLAKPVYLVPTLVRVPYPIMEEIPLPKTEAPESLTKEESIEYGHKSLGRFLFILHVFGVRKILVGGNELIIDDSGDVNKCVGNFVKYLDVLRELSEEHSDFPKIDVRVSEMTGPKSRSDLRGVRDDLIKPFDL